MIKKETISSFSGRCFNFTNRFLERYFKLTLVKLGDLAGLISGNKNMYQTALDAETLYWAVEASSKIKGDIAEVGVYRGGSAKMICEAKGNRNLHLFDTFEGFLNVQDLNSPYVSPGDMSNTSLEEVKDFLKDYDNIYYYKGVFPKTAEPVKDKRFSLVHIDVDIGPSVTDSLEFFYPRMNEGGIIVMHDYYPKWKEAMEAISGFAKDKPECFVRTTLKQCIMVKIKS